MASSVRNGARSSFAKRKIIISNSAITKNGCFGFLRSHPDFVTPSFRQTELVNAVEKLSGDLCISRPKSRLSWGIELPFDRDFVNYVWFDALTNYISFMGYDPTIKDWNAQPDEFRKWWPALHVIGKDIMSPAHGIYWPIMLHALGFPDEQMPKLLVHGWWNISGAKMSKSLGNVVDPDALADKYGVAALRYYLMGDMYSGRDADFAESRLAQRYNTDLANNLGNLLNRTMSMVWKYREGVLARTGDTPGKLFDIDEVLAKSDVCSILGVVMLLPQQGNGRIEVEAPWKIAKEERDGVADAKRKLDSVLYHLAEIIRVVAILISPVTPKAAHGIFDQLNWKMELSGNDERFSLVDAEWGKLPDGHVVGKPTPLFPRIDVAAEDKG